MKNETIILGVDPGLAKTGYGIINVQGNRFSAGIHGVIRTDSKMQPALRLEVIFRQLDKILDNEEIDEVAVEKLFFYKNVTSAIKVAQARGVILLVSALHSRPVYEYTPLEVKQAITSSGSAPKAQVQLMIKSLLNLPAIPKPPDVADALAIAFCHAGRSRFDHAYGKMSVQ